MACARTLFSSLPAQLQVGLLRGTLRASVDVFVLRTAFEDGGGETVVSGDAAEGTVWMENCSMWMPFHGCGLAQKAH